MNTKCMQSGINLNKRRRCGKVFEIQPFFIINQNTESFLKSQREALVKIKEEIESKILSIDSKLARLSKPSPENSGTHQGVSTSQTNVVNTSDGDVSVQRPPSPQMHWSTLQVLNQFF